MIQERVSAHVALFRSRPLRLLFQRASGAYPPDGHLGLTKPNRAVKRMLVWRLKFGAVEKGKILTTQEPGC